LGEVINIGSNFEISIGEVALLIAEIMGVQIQVDGDPVRFRPEKSEVDRLWADNGKARKLLGWVPCYGGREGLKRGLVETVAWFTRAENLINYKSDTYNI